MARLIVTLVVLEIVHRNCNQNVVIAVIVEIVSY